MVSKRMHAQPKDMARKKPCFVQNFEQRLQDLLVLWLWQIKFTGGEKEGCHHGRSCPAFHLIHTLHSTFPGSCKDLETGFWQIVFFVDYKRYKRYLLKIGLVTFCVKRFFKNPRPVSGCIDTSRGSRCKSTPPNNMDSKHPTQSSVHGRPSSGAVNLIWTHSWRLYRRTL